VCYGSYEMVSIEEILNLWGQDSLINQTDLGKESSESQRLHSKYLKLLTDQKMLLMHADFELTKLLKVKHEYYLGTISQEELKRRNWTPNPLKVLRQDLDLFINSDPEFIEQQKKVYIIREKVNVLEGIVKMVMSRQYAIRATMDWVKFVAGC
jgi:hypothetical protein